MATPLPIAALVVALMTHGDDIARCLELRALAGERIGGLGNSEQQRSGEADGGQRTAT